MYKVEHHGLSYFVLRRSYSVLTLCPLCLLRVLCGLKIQSTYETA